MIRTDIAIIGAGPIGLAAAIACRRRGLSHLVFDKGTLVNSLYHYPLNMTFFSTADRLEIGDVPFVSHQPKPNRTEALEYYRRVAMHWQIQTRLYERVLKADRLADGFLLTTDKGNYQAGNMIIATGFYDLPNLLNIPGEKLAKVHHYYREPHPYFNQKILVVGAANSAVDVALETLRKGAEVTMVIRETGIRESVKYWVRPDIENRIAEGSIRAYFHAELTEIRSNEVDILTPDGLITLPNDFVLAMTGYKPDFRFLQTLGIELEQKDGETYPCHNPETMESNIPGIYLAGVICGGTVTNKWFIENSRIHAEIAVDHILQRKSSH